MKDIRQLFEKLDYVFKQSDLLAEAFRHSSYVNERKDSGLRDNERLEFLGDAVLDLAISHILMEFFQDANEGDLSKYRATVVNEKGLFQMARELSLGDYILLGKGEDLSNGREKPSILANTTEALLGALYIDAGFEVTKEIIRRLFLPVIRGLDFNNMNGDYKSMFQEYTQEEYRTLPEYFLMEESGPAHDKSFKVALRLNGKTVSEGEGKSKKEAEQKAAREAFYCLPEGRKKF
ncbi:ribonuclease III [Thermodesulfobacteriota bacterium]